MIRFELPRLSVVDLAVYDIRGRRVRSVPGPVRTRMRNLAYPGEVADSVRPAEDITRAYLFLMGEDGKQVRGQQITLG